MCAYVFFAIMQSKLSIEKDVQRKTEAGKVCSNSNACIQYRSVKVSLCMIATKYV